MTEERKEIYLLVALKDTKEAFIGKAVEGSDKPLEGSDIILDEASVLGYLNLGEKDVDDLIKEYREMYVEDKKTTPVRIPFNNYKYVRDITDRM